MSPVIARSTATRQSLLSLPDLIGQSRCCDLSFCGTGCNPERRNLFKLRLFRPPCVVHVPAQLEVHPEVLRRAEELGHAQRRRRCYASALVDDLIDALVGHVDGVRQLALCKPQRIKEFIQEHFSRMCRCSVCRYANHFLSSPLDILMIIRDFNLVWPALCPDKTDAIAIVYANAMLSLPITLQCLQFISRGHSQVV